MICETGQGINMQNAFVWATHLPAHIFSSIIEGANTYHIDGNRLGRHDTILALPNQSAHERDIFAISLSLSLLLWHKVELILSHKIKLSKFEVVD